ncbi:MAG: hypothetical protein IT159_07545 [Bryobacterales bacterium]|nr:hypothetical protein [Bryobacterales bacterium]
MRERVEIALAIVLMTALGYLVFPGHTYLQADTQVYVPMLERLWDPAVLQRDFMVERPHMAFTIYDETAVALRRLTGWGFREVLAAQQLVFRALGLLGIFLIANSFGLGRRMSLAATGIFALGATIWGPTVLTIEYEPIPRAFSLPLLLLAVGLEARGWPLAAGAAASIAFLFHGPTTIPYWVCYFGLVLWPAERSVRRHRLLGLVPLLVAAAVLGFLSLLQPGRIHSLPRFERIEPWWEALMRQRTPYIWVSLWFRRWYLHYGILAAAAGAAFWRVRRAAPADLRVLLAGFPIIGLLSLPFSYWLLEISKSTLAPQFQPLRAVLFITATAGLLCSIAGLRAAQNGRRLEGFLWLAVAFAIPTARPIQDIFLPNLRDPAILRQVALVLCLSLGALLAVWGETARRGWRTPVWAGVIVMAFLLYPAVGKVQNYPPLHTAGLDELCRWARASTPVEAVFLFPDAGREFYPGIFRAMALRPVYVDWKSGGQGIYQKDFAVLWRERWQSLMAPRIRPQDPKWYAGRGIDFVAVRNVNRLLHAKPVYENSEYSVYPTR